MQTYTSEIKNHTKSTATDNVVAYKVSIGAYYPYAGTYDADQ